MVDIRRYVQAVYHMEYTHFVSAHRVMHPRGLLFLRGIFFTVGDQSMPEIASRLYTDLVNDALTEFAYDADLAGLSYHFSNTTTGLYVQISGYNDKLATLMKDVLQKAKGLKAKPDRLAVMKEQVNICASYRLITRLTPFQRVGCKGMA